MENYHVVYVRSTERCANWKSTKPCTTWRIYAKLYASMSVLEAEAFVKQQIELHQAWDFRAVYADGSHYTYIGY